MESSEGHLTVIAENSLAGRAAAFRAGQEALLHAGNQVQIGSQVTTTEEDVSARNFSSHSHSQTHHKSLVETGTNTKIASGHNITFHGIDIAAGENITAQSQGALDTQAPLNTSSYQESQTKGSGGLFGSKTTEHKQTASSTVVRNQFKAGGKTDLDAEDDNVFQASDLASKKSSSLASHQGKVFFKVAKSTTASSTQRSGKSLWWQSQKSFGDESEKVEMPHIQGDLHVSAAKGVHVEIPKVKSRPGYGKVFTQVTSGPSLEATLTVLEQNPETAWIKSLRQRPDVAWSEVEEESRNWNHKTQGLSAAAAIIISLVVGIVTGGAGASILAVTNGTLSAMANAAFSQLVSSATISMISNQGNISKTLKDMGSSAQVRSFATSVLSAGLTHGISKHLELPAQPKGWEQHLKTN